MKKKVAFILILVVVASFLLQLVFGPYIAARLATWPQLQRLGILRPQAPIVVTNREVVRVSDSQDSVDAASRAKSRLASVAIVQNGQLVRTGEAVSLTADGLFLTVIAAFPTKGANYFLILNDGRVAPISAVTSEPATNLVVVTTPLGSVSVTSFVTSRDLTVGQKVGFVANSNTSFSSRFRQSYVSSIQLDNAAVVNANRPARTFGVQAVGSLVPGEAVITMGGDVAAMWDGSVLISSDVIRSFTGLYFTNNKIVARPLWGFYYRTVTASESNLSALPQGARVVKPDAVSPAVVLNSPAQGAGLVEGDVIIEINGGRIEDGNALEEQLEKFKPRDTVTLNVVRDRKTISLKLIPGELK